ncbi:MAG: hypothetical protein VX294_14230 [Candidatus Latescibacterota bacterium]|nr:hypothetical protein [Candidatus Latescibacterota bacterium]
MGVGVKIERVDFFMRNVRTRFPFRYGEAELTSVPILHVKMRANVDGNSTEGFSADILPPKWFDKDPIKTYRDNVNDLILSAEIASSQFSKASLIEATPFLLWSRGYNNAITACRSRGLNGLTASHGCSLMERALIDGIGKALGQSYFQLLSEDLLGIDLGMIHSKLGDFNFKEILPKSPLDRIQIRHTVGLSDPLRKDDIVEGGRVNDGLPETLEEYIQLHGLSHFKVKVSGELFADMKRLGEFSDLVNEVNYTLSLDGNEQFTQMADFIEFTKHIESELPLLWNRISYIEQPLDRSVALNDDFGSDIKRISEQKPLLIDESDDSTDSFLRAIALGYLGISSKSCKGLIKGIANAALVRFQGSCQYFMTGEDLMNLPLVPLHQDLVHLAALGINNVERNGHHYVRGLDHLSLSERQECLRENADLYSDNTDIQGLRIESGAIRVSSLQRPGLGVGDNVDLHSMISLSDWDFNTL